LLRGTLTIRTGSGDSLDHGQVGVEVARFSWSGGNRSAHGGDISPRMILDLVYNLRVRHLFHAPALPATPRPRQFSYLLSTVLIAGSALSFFNEMSVLGFVLGGMVALGGTILTTTHWCLGSWFYRLFFSHAAV